jgi:alpha-ribazole phosphatase
VTPVTHPLLTLMRHGQVELPTDVCFGWTDVALSTSGRDHVFELAKNWAEPKPSKIWCSDLQRSHETANILADTFSIPYQCATGLREIHFGEWEGRSWDEIYRNDTDAMQHWGEHWQTVAPPGGETAAQLMHRVVTCYQILCAEDVREEDRVLLTAHSGSLRALSCHLQDQSIERFFDRRFDHAVPSPILTFE